MNIGSMRGLHHLRLSVYLHEFSYRHLHASHLFNQLITDFACKND